MTLRIDSMAMAGQVGFRVDILDANGRVIATQDFVPTSQTMTPLSMRYGAVVMA